MTVRDRETGDERTLVAPYFLDATELGDLLPLAGVEFVTGFEAPGARPASRTPRRGRSRTIQQAFTCCFAMDYLDGRGPHDRPAGRVRLLARLRPRSSTPPGRASCSA